ncbi:MULTISPECIES: BlaI/MecI/CopY family transcriptional regulator [Subtercola]|uniref:BlaI/MecI/CopY family transcriptional regulator n=1 Tax=Subtercola vilae TaxID=2056433 RepID=A0A4T2BE33_9MICO|nr:MULTISPECIES: BlaI/MecI/CopY family transcriptional regulator [Subtercola]MEA9985352.1 BlaI/MecI/CopY family transcriptional regulator [Subtercola sp. RTI3]TIH28769.1 BlaI/MecI/CopY family transcriptional regulator [Subtercola vilae]
MATLGDLERSIMERLWENHSPLSAADLKDELAHKTSAGKDLALTTMLTVLSRLERKGFVSRDRKVRPHLYFAVTTRADHTAELLQQVLGAEPDRATALAHFVGQVSPEEAETLRQLLTQRAVQLPEDSVATDG